MSTKVLITGGGGYLGSVLLRYLSREIQYEITVVDNFTWGYNCPLVFNGYSKIQFLNFDLTNDFDFSPYDLIVNLAAVPGEIFCIQDPERAYKVNYFLPLCIATELKPHQSMIQISSTAVYGDRNGMYVHENALFGELGIYAKAKAAVDEEIKYNTNVAILRLGTLFGPSIVMRPSMIIHDMMREAIRTGAIHLYGNAEAIRPVIHVKDAAYRIKIAIGNIHKYKGKILNLATWNIRKRILANKIAEVCGVEVAQSTKDDLVIQDHLVEPIPTTLNFIEELVSLKSLYEVIA